MPEPRFVCTGCGAVYAGPPALPFACAARDPSVDHVLAPVFTRPAILADGVDAAATHPFVRYRRWLASWAVAEAAGWRSADWGALVGELDDAVAALTGRGLQRTPLVRLDGGVWAKAELAQPAGSHKIRHLFGLMLWLRLQETLGRLSRDRPLAIASCGNAALSAATVARAAGWPIQVFVPSDADPVVRERLDRLGADVRICARRADEAGDPTVVAFRAAVAAGALPFCCQGTDNGLTLEGGETLGLELGEQLRASLDHSGDRAGDRAGEPLTLWVQVGGGALGASAYRGLRTALAGVTRAPEVRLVTAQTHGAWPLRRAWAEALSALLCRPVAVPVDTATDRLASLAGEARAAFAALPDPEGWLARGWVRWMRPWEVTPRSIAHGILDDETYDGRALLRAMLETGGWPALASERGLADAAMAVSERDVTETGAAGYAAWREAGPLPGPHVVLLTGLRRRAVAASG